MVADAVIDLVRAHDSSLARLTAALRDILRSGEWTTDGDLSPAAWLARVAGVSPARARELCRVATSLADLPAIAAAYADGRLSRDQVACITAVARAERRSLLAAHEAELLPSWLPLDLPTLTVAMRTWAAYADDLLETAPPSARPGTLTITSSEGRGVVRGDLDPLGRETVLAAIAQTSTWSGDDERTPAERRHDALVEVCRQFLGRCDDGGAVRTPPHVSVVVDLPTLEASGRVSLLDGTLLDAPTSRALLCDCAVHRVITDGPSVLVDLGRAERLVSRHQWHALVLRDKGCRHPGCDRPAAWCHAHHVLPWEHGGPTDLDNLVLKCSRHHHLGHQPGWHDKLLPDGTYVVTTPTGTVLQSRPPP